jgi:hypothetical protein
VGDGNVLNLDCVVVTAYTWVRAQDMLKTGTFHCILYTSKIETRQALVMGL